MSDSDLEIKKIAPMKPVKKPPNSPTEDLLKAQVKKVTTKAMIHEALKELQTRKGVSIQAIKKYMEDRYYVETDKVKYLIKKALKTSIEDGSIIQLKGVGASGSFKLAPIKEKTKKKPETKKEKPNKEKTEKSKEKPTKDKKEKVAMDNKKEKVAKDKARIDKEKPAKTVKMDVKNKEKKEKPKDKKKAELKEKLKTKTAATPAKKKKKATMMKRKSIGSIIKPPKMKPKSRD